MGIYFTSDTHFGHERILIAGSGRPFPSIEEHDEVLVQKWNAVVKPGDTVFHLGDVAWTDQALQTYVRRLNGRKVLVAGNHDACWTRRSKARTIRRAHAAIPTYLEAGFAEVVDSGQTMTVVDGVTLRLSHLPADGDHTAENRYADRRPSMEGAPLVCGHVHDEWTTYGRQVNVGVDRWDFTPVHSDQVLDLVAAMPRERATA